MTSLVLCQANEDTTRNGENNFVGLSTMKIIKELFCKICKKRGTSLQRTGGAWITKPFNNWKKALEKMRAHSQSDVHIQTCAADLAVATTLRDGTIIEQFQNVSEQQRVKNRTDIKALLRCTHFLTLHHIPHTTNFNELVDLIVSCGGQHLQVFLESAGKNAVYTSKYSVVQFVEALGQW